MILTMDAWANINRWRDRVFENWILSGGLLLLALILPPLPSGPLIVCVSLISATLGARIPLKSFLYIMAVPCMFLMFGVIPMIVTFSGTNGSGVPIAFSYSNLPLCEETMLRSFGAVTALILLGTTTPILSQIGFLRRLHFPNTFIEMMMLTYRFLFLLESVMANIITAQSARLGYCSLRTGFRSGSLAFAGLFSHTIAKAQIMERCLAARAYNGNLNVLDIPLRINAKRVSLIILLHVFVTSLSLIWRSVLHG